MRRLLNLTLAILSIGAVTAMTYPAKPRVSFEKNQVPTSSVPVVAASPKADVETERYAVYSALIKERYIGDETKLLVIRQEATCFKPTDDKTIGEERHKYAEGLVKSFSPKLTSDVAEEFYDKQRDCSPLSRRLDVPVKYILVPTKDIEAFFPEREPDLEQMWKRFYEKYPGAHGIISFSNVGFNSEMSQALVSTGIGCGSLCGEGYYVLLTKEQGIWKVQSKVMTWVS